MTLTQQWRHLNLARKSFYILFPAKGIVSSSQIIPSFLYVRLKEACSLAGRPFSTPLNKLSSLNLKITEKHRELRV